MDKTTTTAKAKSRDKKPAETTLGDTSADDDAIPGLLPPVQKEVVPPQVIVDPPRSAAPAQAAPAQAVPPAKRPQFLQWLNSKEGKEMADPRWLPVEPSRREMELERRMRCAWDAALDAAQAQCSPAGGMAWDD